MISSLPFIHDKSLRERMRSAAQIVNDCYNIRAGSSPNTVKGGTVATEDFFHQSDYKGGLGEQPIENVTSMIGLLAQLGVDSLRSFAILVKADPVLIWGHLPSARASLESFAYCRWLAECALDWGVRARRAR